MSTAAWLTCVCIKANYCLESLSSLENVHGQVDLGAGPPCLDTVQSTFQVQPETDFLQCVSRGWVSVEVSNLRSKQYKRYGLQGVLLCHSG